MPSNSLLLFLAVLACVLILMLSGLARRPGNGFRAGDYRAKRLLTAWEVRALREIRAELPRGYYACPQVRLADFIETEVRDPARRKGALNRVSRKSVDFAVIDGAGRVVLVIELDDKTHGRPDRVRRDQMVDAVLAHCRGPLLRVRPGHPVDVARHLQAAEQQPAG
jgi:hypothetical protein